MPQKILNTVKRPDRSPTARYRHQDRIWRLNAARWRQELLLLLLSAVPGGVLFMLGGAISWAIALTFACYALSLLYRLMRLARNVRRQFTGQTTYGLTGLIQDRQRRVRASWVRRQRKLVDLLKRYHRSAMSVPDAMVVLSPLREIEWLNDAACDLLNLTQNDVGLRIDNLIRNPTFVNWLGEGASGRVLEFQSPGDEHRALNLRMEPYGEDRSLLIGRDVTALYRLQGVRQDFVANVSHELRTPLTVLAGYLETLLDSEEDTQGEMFRILTNMHQQSERMRRIVEDLLLLSRLETSRPDEEYFESIDMRSLLETVAHDAQLLSGAEQHQIQLEVDPGLWLIGILRELHSALSNLVFNAVKYTPGGGTITIRWYQNEKGQPVFESQDTGIGIEPRHIPRLTERFYRIDVARSRTRGGTGLGLAIVKHVILRHDAKLDITSQLNQGSVFRVTFPASRAERHNSPSLTAGMKNAQ
ncbi:phosphate regulon sensor histidine kinase PhoR [Halothiobacillus neapolitanus]|uniref:histidine kinase n=1 Tax=Halothiobacillus neapolitanus (strain ATCC 23641 / DSM 15147 / CIP 104769 / NCIMB 8539 / c2) TaxID=555778 RepID=D0KWW1_HALNC|nr:phosphate regulon sensor histidine kinase PhoR [Halothiobacillus neapolitanus]ACX97081.1 histidine kinase [Halothiobacillus neapolitanus c2]TDN58049.1 PAS/PAC sensor signal transduction histidine kinase [Halothiobacillus neapolitanus]